MTWDQWFAIAFVGVALIGLAAGHFWCWHAEREDQNQPSKADLYNLAKSMEEDGFDVDYGLLGIEDLAGNPTPYVLYRNGIIGNSEYANLLYAENQVRRKARAAAAAERLLTEQVRREKIERELAELDQKGVPYSVVRSYQGGIISIQLEGN